MFPDIPLPRKIISTFGLVLPEAFAVLGVFQRNREKGCDSIFSLFFWLYRPERLPIIEKGCCFWLEIDQCSKTTLGTKIIADCCVAEFEICSLLWTYRKENNSLSISASGLNHLTTAISPLKTKLMMKEKNSMRDLKIWRHSIPYFQRSEIVCLLVRARLLKMSCCKWEPISQQTSK